MYGKKTTIFFHHFQIPGVFPVPFFFFFFFFAILPFSLHTPPSGAPYLSFSYLGRAGCDWTDHEVGWGGGGGRGGGRGGGAPMFTLKTVQCVLTKHDGGGLPLYIWPPGGRGLHTGPLVQRS